MNKAAENEGIEQGGDGLSADEQLEDVAQSNEVEQKADCYSDGERATMVRYQNLKQRLLLPSLKLMTKCGITPDLITLFSFVLGLLFCPVYLYPLIETESKYLFLGIAWALLIAHMLVDGVDGPLARFQNCAGQRGSFTDTMADQVALAASTLTFVYAQAKGLPGLGIYSGGYFLFVYTVVVAFAMVRNAMGIPYRFLFRPRYWVWCLLWFETFVFRDAWMEQATEGIVWAFNVLLTINMAAGFRAIRRAL